MRFCEMLHNAAKSPTLASWAHYNGRCEDCNARWEGCLGTHPFVGAGGL